MPRNPVTSWVFNLGSESGKDKNFRMGDTSVFLRGCKSYYTESFTLDY